MEKEILEKINRFTRREFNDEELYTFSVILCDNDIDRDGERFSDNALEKLKCLFVGKTGIFDHEPSTVNQTARIYDTELVTDPERRTKNGEEYKYLKAYAYMVRTGENKDLIAEIDGGIKKEVSISCSAGRQLCSLCGAEKGGCAHVRGKSYSGRMCHTVLDDITDAYEWSFVAVPAQVNAGVTKRFSEDGNVSSAVSAVYDEEESLRRDMIRLAFVRGGRAAADAVDAQTKNMNAAALMHMKKAYEKLCGNGKQEVQLDTETAAVNNLSYKV